MIHVVARISVKKGRTGELVDAFKELLPKVQAEAGCIAYVPTIDAVTDIDRQAPVDADVVTMVEKWKSLEHLKAHLSAAHMLDFRSRIGQLVESSDLRILEEE